MSCINKDEVKVTMSLSDYENLAAYEKVYKNIVNEIRSLGYIDSSTSEEINVVLNKEKVKDYITPFLGDDCELDNYPNGVNVSWK